MKANVVVAFLVSIMVASVATSVLAQDGRAELVQKIAAAQGLTEIFDQQLAQQRESTKGYAQKMFEEAIAAGGGQANPKEIAALDKLAMRAGEMFSGREIAAAWVANYGQELSVQDLQAILNYYESPTGRKDVAANKAAMPAFTSWMAKEAQGRATSLLREFLSELQAARK